MSEKRLSMKQKLMMRETRKLSVGQKIHVKSVGRLIEHIDPDSGEVRKSLILECKEGNFYAPNEIVRTYLEDPEGGKEALEGQTMEVREYQSKKYKTMVKTLSYAADDPEPVSAPED